MNYNPLHTTPPTNHSLSASRQSVEVWTVDLNQPEPFISAAIDCLAPEEAVRARKFMNATARRNYVAAHSAVRRLLAAHLDIAPVAVPLSAGAHGKPELAGELRDRMHFNLSHSGDLALIALSAYSEVGVDVERVRALPEAPRLARRFFTTGEAAALDRIPEAARSVGFLRLWTRKESLLKATGLGITQGLKRFEVSCEAGGGLLAVDGTPTGIAEWSLHSWVPAEGYLAAVAVPLPAAQFSLLEFRFNNS